MAFKEKVKELSRELKIGLSGLTKPRIDLIAMAVISMSATASINLADIAAGMLNDVQQSSNYKRLRRFIQQVDWSWVNLPKFLISLAGVKGPYTVLIDRTNWKFGRVNINILMVAVLGSGFAIPVLWSLLPKRGNSAQFERRDIIELLNKYLGAGQIKQVIADREFIGTHWLNWLITNQIGFVLRIKGNMKVTQNGVTVLAEKLFNKNRKSPQRLPGKFLLLGSEVYLSGFRFRNDKGKLEHLIVATHEPTDQACDLYAQRWYIENMFKDLKTNGFQLEGTHVTKIERLETLLGLLAISYVWMIKIGKWVKSIKPKMFKRAKHKRPRISLFKAGLREYTRSIITRSDQDLWRYIKFLSCT